MGQYYKVVFLAEKQDGSKEIIRTWIEPFSYKLMEHSYLDDDFMHIIEYLLSRKGMFYRSRIVWAGDYAEPEEPKEKMSREEALQHLQSADSDADEPSKPNLYQLCQEDGTSLLHAIIQKKLVHGSPLPYLLNHTKKQFVHMRKDGQQIHPLPLLVSEGNGNGGGDYYGRNQDLCGTWARDVISVDENVPDDYTELVCDFFEE
jgi:hypothetical protein